MTQTPMIAPLAAAVLLASGLAGPTACPAFAQAVATRDPARVQAGAYETDPEHTQIVFAVSHMGFSTYYGTFTRAAGTLELAPETPSGARLEISVPVDTVTTTSAKLTGELKGADWFDAARFPRMTFRSTSVTPTGPQEARVTGDLTLHGVTRPMTLEVRFNGAGINPINKKYTVGFDATGTLRRSEFGMTTYVPLIGDEVRLSLSGAFERRG